MSSTATASPFHGPTLRQRSLRRQLNKAPLRTAVRRAVDVYFRFRFRGLRAEVLWSDTDRVWMGSETFLYWALRDQQTDIPWVVADAVDAPCGEEQLRAAVRAELIAYWTDRIAILPRIAKPHWLPLP